MLLEYETRLYYLGIKVVNIPSVYSLDGKKNDFFMQESSVTKQNLPKIYQALTHDIGRDIFRDNRHSYFLTNNMIACAQT